jgi:hypothetical protein
MVLHKSVGAVGVLIACVGLLGCGSKNPVNRLPVSGTVKLDDTPLDQGLIQFEPPQGAEKAVNASAPINNGTFVLPAEGGLLPGPYKVSISSQPPAAPLPSDPVKAMEEAAKTPPPERLPAKYNVNTELRVEVRQEVLNKFDFDLKSAP